MSHNVKRWTFRHMSPVKTRLSLSICTSGVRTYMYVPSENQDQPAHLCSLISLQWMLFGQPRIKETALDKMFFSIQKVLIFFLFLHENIGFLGEIRKIFTWYPLLSRSTSMIQGSSGRQQDWSHYTEVSSLFFFFFFSPQHLPLPPVPW